MQSSALLLAGLGTAPVGNRLTYSGPDGKDLCLRRRQPLDIGQRGGVYLGQQRQPFDRLTTQLRTGLLSDGLRTYTYDHANRLVQIVSGTLTTGFTYNGAGDRVAKIVDGVTSAYVLDPAAGLTQVLQETTGGQTTSYLYGHDLLAQYDSGTWAYHVDDGLGSVRQLADSAGQVVQSYSFSPFGVPLGESGGEPYGFTGEQWDVSAGLVYLRARYYQPATGRFLSKDPFRGFPSRPQTLNPFAYVRNNPINLVDPVGLQGVQPWEEGVIERVTTTPFFLGPQLRGWLTQAIDNVKGASDLRDTMLSVLQMSAPTSLRGLYQATHLEAMEILAQNYAFERCGEPQHTLELEAAHLSLIVLTYFPVVEDMDTWRRYPVYLAEADRRDIERGWDKAGHFFTAAMASFEYRYSVERGLGEALTWHLVASAAAPIGVAYWAEYEHEAIFRKLLEPGLWETLPPRFNDYHDFQAYMAVAMSMAAFEVLTTAPIMGTEEQYL
jgi:RHS repeat-associated protein